MRPKSVSRRRIGDFAVVDTPGKGRGVFAVRAYREGEALMPISGEPVPGRGTHTIQVGRQAHIKPGEPFLFTNHSCDPNAGIRADASGRPGLYARRAIAAGEEITWDYAMSELDLIVDGRARSMICSCGSQKCRRLIENGWGGLSAERREVYRDWIMPYLREDGPR
ncbi:MAG: SET domain-containing protein-lysine N-methyltransferase [Elusimicrobia bacterium CG11_big_fil_rev_8_21_14_0_20_64_6]|nr:MAG: SET domain-containing protein-lysine N-methyltransferase [Elusimicrobia bacterium CG11_big_fil_rev_8_21_14_0_20_64_6]